MPSAAMKTATMEAAGMDGPAVEAAAMESGIKAAMETASDATYAPRKVVVVIRIIVAITGW
jgi:hypothetical protein